jgi:hypothetical protein
MYSDLWTTCTVNQYVYLQQHVACGLQSSAPLCMGVHHCAWVCTTVYHCAPLFTTLHHSAPLWTTLHHSAPLWSLNHCAPLCTTVHHCAPLCTTVHHCAPLCTTVHHCAHCDSALGVLKLNARENDLWSVGNSFSYKKVLKTLKIPSGNTYSWATVWGASWLL